MAERQKVALISVYEKERYNIAKFAAALVKLGWRILSSGGTAKYLRDNFVEVTDVAELIGGGAILGHRVVTLSREVHAGLLAQDNEEDQAELDRLGIPRIDMFCGDFYPLKDEIARPGSTRESVINQTDIGGPTMARSAAKGGRITICDPADRAMVLKKLQNGGVDDATIQQLRAKAEFIVAGYCLDSALYHGVGDIDGFVMELCRELAYGENRNQSPAFLFTTGSDDPLATSKFKVESGDPSYISIADGAGLIGVMRFLSEAYRKLYSKVPHIVVAGKHGNVCGIGVDWSSPTTAIRKALMGDKTAVMGGEVVTNFAVTDELGAELMSPPSSLPIGRQNWGLDIIYAPEFSTAAVELLGKREKRRLLSNPALADPQMPTSEWMWQFLGNGDVLKQKAPKFILSRETIEEWVGVPMSDDRFEDLLIAWVACYRASSNTVALAKNRMLIGLGCGQQDRIACVRLCIERARRAGHNTEGAVFASDAFFPYAEGEQPPVDLAHIEWLLNQAKVADRAGNQREMIKLLAEMATLISSSDRREGTELLIDAGCVGGVVPADGMNLEYVKTLFGKSGLSVAFVNKDDRMFSKH